MHRNVGGKARTAEKALSVRSIRLWSNADMRAVKNRRDAWASDLIRPMAISTSISSLRSVP